VGSNVHSKFNTARVGGLLVSHPNAHLDASGLSPISLNRCTGLACMSASRRPARAIRLQVALAPRDRVTAPPSSVLLRCRLFRFT
jgi:hypothetical protein